MASKHSHATISTGFNAKQWNQRMKRKKKLNRSPVLSNQTPITTNKLTVFIIKENKETLN